MNIFGKRPLALISAIVIFVSFCVHKLAAPLKIAVISAAVILFAVALTVSLKSARRKLGAMLVCLCAAGAVLAATVQLFSVDIRAARARELEGDHYCELLIIEDKTSSALNAYEAVLRDADGERVSFDANLYLLFDGELDAGDLVRVRASLSEAGSIGGLYADGADLDVFVYDSGSCALVSEGNFSFRSLFAAMRGRCAVYLEDSLGEECGALARGILLGDTEGMDRVLIRDFRRSGASHLLAVSGLHISMLVAMVDAVLWKLSVGRRARSTIISVLSLVFLGLTGFATSACRSVFMLLFVYLNYLFVQESDSLTSLFAAVAVIMLISPGAATDVGLWLSFFATLGIISVYSPISKYLKAPRKRGFWRWILRMLSRVALALFLCFVCNVFTAFVVWIVFGEVSAVTLISNLVLAPLSLVFLAMIPVGVLLGGLGVIGAPTVRCVAWVAELIKYLCGVFSEVRGALISLEYGFAGVIIIAMTAALGVMLVIKMKRKPLILVPPVAAAVAFAICLSVHNAVRADELALTYRLRDTNEMLVVSERSQISVIDVSSGAYGFLGGSLKLAKQSYATEIGDLVLTHYHAKHPASLALLCERTMLRRVYLPDPLTEEEWQIAREVLETAERYGCEVVTYQSWDTLELLSDTRVRVDVQGEGRTAVFVANGEEALAYIGGELEGSEGAERFSALADYVIFGVHGCPLDGDRAREEGDRNFILH